MKRTVADNSTITRRGITALLAGAPLLAQVNATPPTPAPATGKALVNVKEVSDRLAQTEVPMSLEPAFSFRA